MTTTGPAGSIGKLGFRIRPGGLRPPGDVLARFQGLASANVADAMGRFNFMDAGIRSRTGRPLSGPALTVVCRPGDNLMLHKALAMAAPGDVVVVGTGGNVTSAVFGELMGRSAASARIGGLVVDGAVRDVEALTQLRLPVFSRSVCPGGCDKDGPGEINVPIACGGAAVLPGDIIVGDEDGVAVVPQADADAVLAAVAAVADRERQRVEEIRSGRLFRADVDDLLRRKGVIE
jgi:regulator of RNase E activity RraA